MPPWDKYQKPDYSDPEVVNAAMRELYPDAETTAAPWTKYSTQDQAPVETAPPISKTSSAISGAADAASMGFGDEALAALAAPVMYGAGKVFDIPNISGKGLSDLYQERRGVYNAQDKAAQEANPLSYLAGQIGGGVTALGALGRGTQTGQTIGNIIGRGLLPNATSGIGQAANLASKIGASAATGAASSGLYGYGSGEGDERLKNAQRDMVYGGVIGGAAPPLGSALSKLGTEVGKHADVRALADKTKFLQDLITPHSTPTVRAEQFSRSKEQGLFRNRVVEPTPQEIEIMDTISSLPISKNKSLLANHNIIEEAKDTEAQNLMAALKQNDVAIDPVDIDATLNSSLVSLKNSPFITGDAEKSAERVIEGMKEALKKNPSTASGLLQARKDFDAWVKAQKGKGVFDPSRDSAVTTAVQHVRQSINDLVEQRVPQIGFKDSLRKQSNMYRALDNIETKGGYEAPNAIKRTAEKVADLIPVKSGLAKGTLAAAGIGGALTAPAATAGALALYGTQKALRSPKVQKAVGKTLKVTGDILKDPLRKNP